MSEIEEEEPSSYNTSKLSSAFTTNLRRQTKGGGSYVSFPDSGQFRDMEGGVNLQEVKEE
jgi:hypothetical protein